ncbi:MAG: peptidoglycan recognition family protein, partial [Planctomycetota bacterium]
GVPDVGLVLQPRSAWQARAADPGNVTPMGRIHRLTIHHSALYFRDTRPATCAAQIQKIQREHMQGREFGDIGYHFLIDPSGRIWQGRDLRWQGAHASGNHNVGNIGICVLGNFVRGRNGQAPPAAQVRALRQLTAMLAARHGIAPDAVYSHSDFKATECPGALLQPVIDQLVRDLHRGGSAAVADVTADP